MKLKLILVTFIILFLTAIFLVLHSKSKPALVTVDPAFSKYISGYSSGMVSRHHPIKLELATEMPSNNLASSGTTGTNLPDSNLLKNCFSFFPAIKGHAVFTSARNIEFIPSEPLKEQTLYTANFKLSRLREVDPKCRSFKFQFSTYAQNLFVEVGAATHLDAFNIEWQQISGTVKISDKEDTLKLYKTITASQDGKKLHICWQQYDDNNYEFTIDSIQRKTSAEKVEISWSGNAIGAVQTGHAQVDIPALGDFTVTKTEVKEDEKQYVTLTFSDPIKSEQDLKGFITLEKNENLNYTVEGNQVNIYLPNRLQGSYTLNVYKGIRNFKGYTMNQSFSTFLEFEAAKPLVRIKGKGNILPNSQGLLMPFESIGLKAVDVRIIKIYQSNIKQFLQVNDLDGNDELKRVGKVISEHKILLPDVNTGNLNQWTKHVLNLKNLMTPDPSSIYRVSIKFKKSYTSFDCPTGETDEIVETDDEGEMNSNDWTENDWHGYNYDNGYDSWESYDDSYSPCDRNYYDGKAVSRNMLASDLGIIYKLDDNKLAHIYVNNMLNTEPVDHAEIEVVDYTNQTISSGSTNAQGMLEIHLKNKPFLIIAKKGNQRGYLKVTEGLVNSLSKFEIEGEQPKKGVKGFIYAERGVWRPGDSMYVSFILEDKQHQIPAHHPVKFKLQDPHGATVYETTSTNSIDHTYDFRCATSPNAKTGNYQAVVTIGNNTFSKRLNVETVKPNRLKIKCVFPDSLLSLKTKDQPIQLQARWLHGGTAKNLKASVDVVITNTETKFPKYTNYIFQSPLKASSSNEIHVYDGQLNETGTGTFSSVPTVSKNMSGLVKATYITKVFEPGGDFSIDRSQVLFSPFTHYVGLELPGQQDASEPLQTNKNHVFNISMVNEKGNPSPCKQLRLCIYKLKWQWWYEHDEEDFSNFVTKFATDIVKDSIITASVANTSFHMNIKEQSWGRYLITVTDMEGGHQTGATVYFDIPYRKQGNRINNENATMLKFSTDKTSYKKGEKIKLSIPSTAKGKALISIENGSKVLQSQWISTMDRETRYEITANAEMAPNIYIHVTYLQPHLNTMNDLPIRMYGVIPVEVIDETTILYPVIETASVIRPEENTTVRIRERAGKKMTYTLALVDDGLLDLTHFRTPQPWTSFFAKQALGVKTWDMYDQVIGAYAGKLDAMISIGGDGEYDEEYSNKANRFVPVVKYIGPFTLEKGQTATHKIAIPNYTGSVRMMVVAQHDGSYGNAEKDITVKKPLMLLATLPRVFSSAEEIEMPVTVFAMENNIKEVQVTVEANEFVSFENNKQSIHFSSTGDEILNFRLHVKNKTGIARIRIKASCGKETASQELEVDVRVPNPILSQSTDMIIEPGKSLTQNILFNGIEGSNSAVVELSTLPPLGLDKRFDYLIQYPHGCIEQTTSGAFPQLYVSNLVDINDTLQRRITSHIQQAIRRIQLFQTMDGGFSYWPEESQPSEFGSNYAGHFLLEAEKNGYLIPTAMKNNWLNYQKTKARRWTEQNPVFVEAHDEETHQFLQAYRLYTLALNNTPETGAMNQLREERNLKPATKFRLAAAYKLIGQYEVANLLIRGLSPYTTPYRELSYGYGSALRDNAMILETMTLLKDPRAGQLAQKIVDSMNTAQWLSTQETAYCLLSLCKFYGADQQNPSLRASYILDGMQKNNIITSKKISKIFLAQKIGLKQRVLTINNTGSSRLYIRVTEKGAPLVGETVKRMNGLAMSIVYKNNKNEIILPTQLVQGTDFKAVVTIANNSDKRFLREMVLSQLFPEGWEIHNARMDGTETASAARYLDIRDDRVYTYYDLPVKTIRTFTIQLNATYLGKFYLPAINSEAMYDHSIHATLPGYWVNVVREEKKVVKK